MLIERTAMPKPMTRAEHRQKYRKTESGKEEKRRYSRKKSERDYLAKRFVAWDGEGVTRSPGAKQDYVLFMHSDGEPLAAPERYLGTEEIFRFIMREKQDGVTNVIYGATYDWNMWLRDLPRTHLERLHKTDAVSWGDWTIKWRPGKEFRLKNNVTGDKVLFYDVVSLFQSSFIVACDKNLKERFVERDLIVKNKAARGSFTENDIEEVTRYTRAELVNLVLLMDDLRLNLFNAGLRVGRWDGPGAVAVALFQQHNVKDAKRETRPDEYDAVHSAYFGGRFEVCHTGYTSGAVYEYDINSAYPWALQDVPTLAGGHWECCEGDARAGDTDFILYRATFSGNASDSVRPFPLPHRDEKGYILYPRDTTGWWWGPEINVARKYVEKYPEATLTIHETWIFRPVTDEKPFAFIEPLFQQRLTYKKQKNGAEKGIKLGLNSMYGKLAQQVGWTIDRKTGELRIPPYHQMEWAGYVTSRCRAAVYEAVLDDLDSVIAFETDAVFTSRKIRVREGESLGAWEYVEFQGMAYLQSGTYFAHEVDKKTGALSLVEKTRGVDRGEIGYKEALHALETDEHIPAKLTRFFALPLALAQKFDKWLTWETMTKNVNMIPGDKRTHVHEVCYDCSQGSTLRERMHETFPRSVPKGSVSQPKLIEWLDNGTQIDEEAQMRRADIERYGEYD